MRLAVISVASDYIDAPREIFIGINKIKNTANLKIGIIFIEK